MKLYSHLAWKARSCVELSPVVSLWEWRELLHRDSYVWREEEREGNEEAEDEHLLRSQAPLTPTQVMNHRHWMNIWEDSTHPPFHRCRQSLLEWQPSGRVQSPPRQQKGSTEPLRKAWRLGWSTFHRDQSPHRCRAEREDQISSED